MTNSMKMKTRWQGETCRVVQWYDDTPGVRSWVACLHDNDGNQLGDAEYWHSKRDRDRAVAGLILEGNKRDFEISNPSVTDEMRRRAAGPLPLID